MTLPVTCVIPTLEDRELLSSLCSQHDAEAVSALDKRSLRPLALRLGAVLKRR